MRRCLLLCLVAGLSVTDADAETTRGILDQWAARDLPDWRTQGKVVAPRVLLARFKTGEGVPEANAYLAGCEPWAGSGSDWLLHRGDYSFTLVTLTTILWLFGANEEVLYPQTRRHLLDVLLNEKGGRPKTATPRTLGLFPETENHMLMTESSRYLTNAWLWRTDGDPMHDNASNGLQAWLTQFLENIRTRGFLEFNSRPYEGYSMHALLNLASFDDGPVGALAGGILDGMARRHALASIGNQRSPPFRRQIRWAGMAPLDDSPFAAYAAVWNPTGAAWGRNAHHALIAACLPWRIPAWREVLDVDGTREVIFARWNNRTFGSPEIYTRGGDFVLAAGGWSHGWLSAVVPGPAILLLGDGATDARDCFHLPGAGPVWRWNSTGVFGTFACGPRPVHVPPGQIAEAHAGGWRVFRPLADRNLRVAVLNNWDGGLLCVFPDDPASSSELAAALHQANPSPEVLRKQFRWPNGSTVEFDRNAPAGVWMIRSHNGRPLERNPAKWPIGFGTEWIEPL